MRPNSRKLLGTLANGPISFIGITAFVSLCRARPSGTTSWYINITQTGHSTSLMATGVKRRYRRHNKRLCYNINNTAEAVIFNDCRLHDMFGAMSTSVLGSLHLRWCVFPGMYVRGQGHITLSPRPGHLGLSPRPTSHHFNARHPRDPANSNTLQQILIWSVLIKWTQFLTDLSQQLNTVCAGRESLMLHVHRLGFNSWSGHVIYFEMTNAQSILQTGTMTRWCTLIICARWRCFKALVFSINILNNSHQD